MKMTIHRALSELKLIDSKIESAIVSVTPSGIFQNGKDINGYIKKEEFEKDAKSNFDSVLALIGRKIKIKSAIVESNSKTIVKIGDKEYSVADAISMKASSAIKNKFIDVLFSRHKKVIGDLNTKNENVTTNCNVILQATFGKDNTKVSPTDLESVRKPFMEANEFHLFDPLSVVAAIQKIKDDTANFMSEVDAVLSESNAVTFIEIQE